MFMESEKNVNMFSSIRSSKPFFLFFPQCNTFEKQLKISLITLIWMNSELLISCWTINSFLVLELRNGINRGVKKRSLNFRIFFTFFTFITCSKWNVYQLMDKRIHEIIYPRAWNSMTSFWQYFPCKAIELRD